MNFFELQHNMRCWQSIPTLCIDLPAGSSELCSGNHEEPLIIPVPNSEEFTHPHPSAHAPSLYVDHHHEIIITKLTTSGPPEAHTESSLLVCGSYFALVSFEAIDWKEVGNLTPRCAQSRSTTRLADTLVAAWKRRSHRCIECCT